MLKNIDKSKAAIIPKDVKGTIAFLIFLLHTYQTNLQMQAITREL